MKAVEEYFKIGNGNKAEVGLRKGSKLKKHEEKERERELQLRR